MPTPRKKPSEDAKDAGGKGEQKSRTTTRKASTSAKSSAKKPASTSVTRASTRKRSAGTQESETTGSRGYDLVIVESPAKAKTINKYLGSNYKVLASYGHVRDLATNKKGVVGEEVQGIRISDGWKLRYAVDAGSKSKKRKGRRTQREILDELKAAASKAKRVLLASDPDREGESIAWHIADELQLEPDRTYRIRFNEITKPAIQQALANIDQIKMERVKSQEARRAMDRVVGFPLSDLLGDKVTFGLSAGRVQSVAVKLIVDREAEIEAFRTEEYWKLTALLSPEGSGIRWKAEPRKSKIYAKKKPGEKVDEKPASKPDDADAAVADEEVPEKLGIPDAPAGTFLAELARWEGGEVKISSEADADRLVAALTNVPYVVSSIEQSDRQEKAPPPFKTTTLQQQANMRLRFSAKRTMDTAQRLYEGIDMGGQGPVALITYMRTDSTRISNDAVNAARGFIENQFGDKYLPTKPNVFASGKNAQEAHECIRPTDVSMTPQKAAGMGLAGDQLKLYTLIWNRFVACQMGPALFAVTSVEVTAAQGLFRATGRILKFDGYRRVLAPAGKQEDTELPALTKDQKLTRHDLFATQHFTQPPPRFNEASLVKMMEKEGIGRPSTYASTIQTIQDRGYVEQKDRRFFATGLGKVVTKLLVEHFPRVMDLKFTSHFEEELDDIETGKCHYEEVLNEFWGPFSQALAEAKVKMPVQRAVETGEKCPECGRSLITLISRKTKRPFTGCSGYKEEPPCRYIKPGEGEEARPKPELTDIPCPKCSKFMLKRVGKTGPFLGCSGYPECKTTMNFDAEGKPVLTAVETEHKCDKCGKPLVKREGKRGPFLGCTGYPKCRNVVDIDASGNPIKPASLGINCDKCGEPMAIKKGFRGPFLACTGYPKCRNAKNLTAEMKEQFKDLLPPTAPAAAKSTLPKVEITEQCPECGSAMRLQKSRFGGRYFLGCSKYPKCKGTAKISNDLEFRIKEAEASSSSEAEAN